FRSQVGSDRLSFAVFFFFFQAEDGIRDLTVTGVQTCALPICAVVGDGYQRIAKLIEARGYVPESMSRRIGPTTLREAACLVFPRSEERRVGKEWRSRWAAEQ